MACYRRDLLPISENLTTFERFISILEQVRFKANPLHFYKETAYCEKVKDKLSYYSLFSKIKSRDYSYGSGYLTHGFDFYKGNFHGQMVRALINCCNLNEQAIILDPFCGSGTTLVESKLLGFDSIGIDINPIACLNSCVKTRTLDVSSNFLLTDNHKYFDMNYYNRNYPINFDFQKFLKFNIKELFYVFLFTRAISDETYISKKRIEAFQNNFRNSIKTLQLFEELNEKIKLTLGKAHIIFGDTLNQLKKFKHNSIDAVITSPPYINLIDYIQNDINQIRQLLNINKIKFLKGKLIGRTSATQTITENDFWNEINLLFNLIYRILKNNRLFILVVSAYKKMSNNFIEIAIKNKFTIETVLKRDVVSQNNNKNAEFVLFLRK